MSTPPSLRGIVGARIRAVRHARGLTAPALAALLDWPLDTLLNYEYGRRPMQLDRLEALAAALDIPAIALLIPDDAAAALLARLVADHELVREVQFFVDALEAEAAPGDDTLPTADGANGTASLAAPL